MKKLQTLFLILLILSFCFSACKGDNINVSSNSEDVESSSDVEYNHSTDNVSNESSYNNSIISEYSESENSQTQSESELSESELFESEESIDEPVENDSMAKDYKYVIENGGVKLIKYIGQTLFDNNIPIMIVKVPKTIEGYPVRIIGTGLFRNGWDGEKIDQTFYNLVDIQLPDSITRIEKEAFSGLGQLSSFNIPKSLTYIGDYAFLGSRLKITDLPSSVSYIGDYAFSGSRVSFSDLPNSITYIGAGAFKDCDELTSITIPEKVKKIFDSTFEDCLKLTAVKLPTQLDYIGEKAFFQCYVLEDIEVPSTVKFIGAYALHSTNQRYETGSDLEIVGDGILLIYRSTTEIFTVPKSIKTICASAFDNGYYNYIKKVVLHSGITKIEKNTFTPLQNLEEMDVPSYVTYIGPDAFPDSPWLNSKTDDFVIIGDGILIKCNNVESSIIIPNNVKQICPTAIGYLNNLKEIRINEGIFDLGAFTFWNCYNLERVYLPTSLKKCDDLSYIAEFPNFKYVYIKKGSISEKIAMDMFPENYKYY